MKRKPHLHVALTGELRFVGRNGSGKNAVIVVVFLSPPDRREHDPRVRRELGDHLLTGTAANTAHRSAQTVIPYEAFSTFAPE